MTVIVMVVRSVEKQEKTCLKIGTSTMMQLCMDLGNRSSASKSPIKFSFIYLMYYQCVGRFIESNIVVLLSMKYSRKEMRRAQHSNK